MYQVINATPHPFHVLKTTLTGDVRHLVKGDGNFACGTIDTDDGPAWVIPPSGYRLAGDAVVTGPTIGCSVHYVAPAETLEEVRSMRAQMYGIQGVGQMVICSEISARCVGDIDDGVLGIQVCWPVLAAASVRKPPGQRWCEQLAAVQRDVRNADGEVVATVPYWDWSQESQSA